MKATRTLLAALFVVIGLAGGAWFLALAWHGGSAPPEYATVLPVAQPLPAFTLTDEQGATLDRDALAGRWHLLFFGFTHCPDICPATLSQLAAARRQLQANGQSPLPDILLISVDPERDTPQVLARYVGRFGAGMRGATGSMDEVESLAAALGIHFSAMSHHGGGDYDVNHSAAVLVVDPDVQLAALFSAPHSVAAFVSDLPRIIGAR